MNVVIPEFVPRIEKKSKPSPPGEYWWGQPTPFATQSLNPSLNAVQNLNNYMWYSAVAQQQAAAVQYIKSSPYVSTPDAPYTGYYGYDLATQGRTKMSDDSSNYNNVNYNQDCVVGSTVKGLHASERNTDSTFAASE